MASVCYIVSGSSGEYSDYSEWAVRVYTDKAEADAFAQMANDWLRARGIHHDAAFADYEVRNKICDDRPLFDRDLRIDYTGSDYVVIGPVLFNPKEEKVMGYLQDDARNAAERLGRSDVFMFNDEPCVDIVREQAARVSAEICNVLTPMMEALGELGRHHSGWEDRKVPTAEDRLLRDAHNGSASALDLCRRMRGEKP